MKYKYQLLSVELSISSSAKLFSHWTTWSIIFFFFLKKGPTKASKAQGYIFRHHISCWPTVQNPKNILFQWCKADSSNKCSHLRSQNCRMFQLYMVFIKRMRVYTRVVLRFLFTPHFMTTLINSASLKSSVLAEHILHQTLLFVCR